MIGRFAVQPKGSLPLLESLPDDQGVIQTHSSMVAASVPQSANFVS